MRIASYRPVWIVRVEFDTAEKARNFSDHLTKVRDKGGSPLYSSLLATSLKEAQLIEITKEEQAG